VPPFATTTSTYRGYALLARPTFLALAEKLRREPDKVPPRVKEIAAPLQALLANRPMLSQALAGFHDGLIMRRVGDQLPPLVDGRDERLARLVTGCIDAEFVREMVEFFTGQVGELSRRRQCTRGRRTEHLQRRDEDRRPRARCVQQKRTLSSDLILAIILAIRMFQHRV